MGSERFAARARPGGWDVTDTETGELLARFTTEGVARAAADVANRAAAIVLGEAADYLDEDLEMRPCESEG